MSEVVKEEVMEVVDEVKKDTKISKAKKVVKKYWKITAVAVGTGLIGYIAGNAAGKLSSDSSNSYDSDSDIYESNDDTEE